MPLTSALRQVVLMEKEPPEERAAESAGERQGRAKVLGGDGT